MINSIVSLNKNIEVKMCDNENYKYNWISAINSAEVKCDDKSIGYISELDINIKDNIDKKSNIVVIELSLDELNNIVEKKKVFKEFSKYQAVEIDISVIVDKTEKYSSIERAIKNVNIDNLLKYELIDIFENQKILLNKKSITIRFTLLSNTHTLSSEEINDDLERLISGFERSGYIVKR